VKILVTGASGRIGGAICRHLAPAHEVTGLDRLPSPGTGVVVDLAVLAARPDALRRLLAGVDAVIHCAALHAPQVGLVPDALFEAVNVHATEALAQACVDVGVGRFVFTSTTALYGAASTPPGRAGWVDELTRPQPRTVYHRTKLAAEGRLQALAERSTLGVTVLRMARCFPEPAPRMAVYRLHRGVDERDVAQAHALAVQAVPVAGSWRCFVVSGATPFEPADAPALRHDAPSVIRHRAPALALAFERRGWPLPASIDRVYDARHAMQHLGWQPGHGFESVLDQWDRRAPQVLAPETSAGDGAP
jgi:nucleoside-diphosphate-sugar epimerase